ncbi:MAG TPA: alpha/beta fold hydrolase [Dokdonella sp.]|uniref:alpha/beta hydrolase family protein n=1 Tax=Dokdonella sp. TaxID=2291710 RepID=UPI002D7EB34D|nr:alpha/beta fold hydrolase [Dokdonella sp.]HET9033727.1 alpha/beta fold hydrolase [Dokdonella sp.]
MNADDVADHDFNSIRVRSDDGAEADLDLICPTTAALGVLWLPALGVTSRHYRAFARALASEGFAVALLEWRGAGSSSLRAARDCNWGYRELLEDDIPASLEAARKAHPQLRWVVGGHSLGAQLGALFAAMRPDALEGFAFAASGSPYWRTFTGKMRWLLRSVPWLVAVATAVCGYYPGKRLGFAGREASQLMRDWARSSKAGCYESYFEGTDSERALAKFGKPVLGIRLSDDRLCPEESFNWLLKKFHDAPVERVLLTPENFSSAVADHFSWLKDPQPVAECLAKWLRELQSRDASTSAPAPMNRTG